MYLNKIILITLCGAFALSSCSHARPEDDAPKQFCLSDTMKRNVVITPVNTEIVKNSISLSGKIEANEDKWVKVFPVVSGLVEELKVNLGDYVTKGQTLAVVRSSEIADYRGQLTAAQSTVRISEKNLNDTREMAKSGLATDKDVVSAETDLEKAKADLTRLQQTNNIFGTHENATQVITAPMSGYIIEKNVTDKMQYKTDGTQPFFVIANLDEVWVMANVFESDISKIKEGYDAEIKSIAYNDKTFTGKVDRIFPILDPQSRVMKVRIRIPNPDRLLKPEMFARINILYDDNSNQLPSIPASAVIFDKNKNFVMVYHDPCNIETREVTTFETIGDVTYIKSGLQQGERIISRYQLLVYEALND